MFSLMISVFPLAYFIVRTQYKIHGTYKNVCQWTVYVIGEASSQQVLGVKSYRFLTAPELVPLTPALFKGQLCVVLIAVSPDYT